MSERKSNAGRRNIYETHIKSRLEEVTKWAAEGRTERDIAAFLGISHETLYKYKKQELEFFDALIKGKIKVDNIVENALLKRALGYEYEEVKTFIEVIDGKEKRKVEKIKKHVSPDPAAQMIWLKNRKKGEWINNPSEYELKCRETEIKEKDYELRKKMYDENDENIPMQITFKSKKELLESTEIIDNIDEKIE